MTTSRKTISIILSLLLVLTMLPISKVTIFATEETNIITDEESLKTALASGGEYELGNDVAIIDSVNHENDVTTVINLNEYSITSDEVWEICVFSGSLTVYGGNITKVVPSVYGGTLTLKDVSVDTTASSALMNMGGYLLLEDVTVNAPYGNCVWACYGTTEIISGTYTCGNNEGYDEKIINYPEDEGLTPVISVYGGTFSKSVADYVADGYEETEVDGFYVVAEIDTTPDFSDAQILTFNDSGILCIDGVEVSYNSPSEYITHQYIPSGKYKLASDISTTKGTSNILYTDADSEVLIDLNGYTLSSNILRLYVKGSLLSIYDTSAEDAGKIASTSVGSIFTYSDGANINLYSGTLDNVRVITNSDDSVINLYGGKITSSGDCAVLSYMQYSSTINLYDTVLEVNEGNSQIFAQIYETPQATINVADYSGDSLTVEARVDIAGKIKLLEGIENAEQAEKYTINITSDYNDCFVEKTEYDETAGAIYLYSVANAFTQQPTIDNNYTVEFNNSDATFQWYEVEKTTLTDENTTVLGDATYENGKWSFNYGYVELFTVNVKAGDMIIASTTSDTTFNLDVYSEDYSINESVMEATGTASITIDADAEVTVSIFVGGIEPCEFEFELMSTTTLDGETGKALQKNECQKQYMCIATVGENTYISDTVAGNTHDYDETGVCACGEKGFFVIDKLSSQIRFNTNDDGTYAETFDIRTRAKILDEDFQLFIGETNEIAEKSIKKAGFVFSINPEAFSIDDAKAVAQGTDISGYTDAPVQYIQDADGYYAFTCIITGAQSTELERTLVSFAYICVETDGVEYWYFMSEQAEADFNSLYTSCIPRACETYGWHGSNGVTDVQYEWSDDGTSCTATGLCAICGAEFTETVQSVAEDKNYVAYFDNEYLETQTTPISYIYDESTNTYAVYDSEGFNKALTTGGNIVLNTNLEEAFTVENGIIIALDLNGYTISVNDADTVITVNLGAALTITDSGENGGIYNYYTGDTRAIINSGTLTITEGTISANEFTVDNQSTGMLYVSGGEIISDYGLGINNNGELFITGGTVTSNHIAVYNDGTMILSGAPVLEGGNCDIYVYNPIIVDCDLSACHYTYYEGCSDTFYTTTDEGVVGDSTFTEVYEGYSISLDRLSFERVN